MGLSRKKHVELWVHVENEGFGYYMLYYGPDMEALVKLGFNAKKIEEAIKLFKNIEAKINEAQEFEEQF